MKQKVKVKVNYADLDFFSSSLTEAEQSKKILDCEKVWTISVHNSHDIAEVGKTLRETINQEENVEVLLLGWTFIQ